jgi:hypothetical protein
MDANIDNEDEQQQAEVEQQEQQAAVDPRRRRHLKIISVLEKKEEFPLCNINKMDELIEEFLDKLETDVHALICNFSDDDGYVDNDNDPGDDADYRGLDSDRDTEKEVETAIRFFPNVLTRKGGRLNEYPIQCSLYLHREYRVWYCNMKAVSFITLLARLAIELGLFEEQYRGGLLCQDIYSNQDNNAFENLMRCYRPTQLGTECHEPVDDKYLHVLIQLRKMGLLKKEDIQRYDLINKLCSQVWYFAEKQFRFLVEWDPSALIKPNIYGGLPIGYVAIITKYDSSIRGFQLVFEYGIRYFSKNKGINILFHKHNKGETPFQMACKKFGRNEVIKIIEDTLARYSDTLLNVGEALLSAAIDENSHLDCVYFLLRREPDVLVKLQSQSQSSGTATATSTASDSNNNN